MAIDPINRKRKNVSIEDDITSDINYLKLMDDVIEYLQSIRGKYSAKAHIVIDSGRMCIRETRLETDSEMIARIKKR